MAYRPPTNGEFWFHLQNNIDNLNSTNTCNILIIGDLNADFNSQQGNHVNSFTVENSLNVLIKELTCITDTSSTVLYHCLTNFPNYIKTSGTEPPIANNDHCTIYVKLLFQTKKSKCYRKLCGILTMLTWKSI